MKQITEDYVSYEVAKLLKEKGFPQSEYANTLPYYTQNKNLYFGDINTVRQRFYNKAIAPSQSLALKWLREVHNIYIDILTYTTGKSIQFRWVGYDNGRLFSQEEGKTIYFNSYNEAVEAALKYTLENLI